MNCPEEKGFVDYLKEEMPSEMIEEFEKHIERCDECAARLYRMNEQLQNEAFIKRTHELLQKLQGV